MDNLMAPISDSHPAVGMVVAGDAMGLYTYLTRMDVTLASLGVELMSGTVPSGGVGSSSALQGPIIGMNVEKVGRTTAYSSATILGTHFDIQVDTGSALGTIEYTSLAMCMFFSMAGDSGSVACLGGNGNLPYVQEYLTLLTSCELLAAIAEYYSIPLDSSVNSDLADELRDKFLSQSKTGQLLIATTYLNTEEVTYRLSHNAGSSHYQSLAQTRAASLYSQYHSLAQALITSNNPSAVITSGDLSMVESVLIDLRAAVMITSAESSAGWVLYDNVLVPTNGMNRQQLIDYMNQSSIYQTVYDQIAGVGTLSLPGPISAIPQE
jgi:hypothetical protein